MTDTFFVPQMNFCAKIISIKRTHEQGQFLWKKTKIFFVKSLFTMFYSLVYISNNFFHSVFCPLNYFGWSRKFKNLQESRVHDQYHDPHVFQLQCILLCSQEALKRLKAFIKFVGICPPVTKKFKNLKLQKKKKKINNIIFSADFNQLKYHCY